MLNTEIISTTIIYTGESRPDHHNIFTLYSTRLKKTSKHCADSERSNSQPPDQNIIQARQTRPDLAEKYQFTIPYIATADRIPSKRPTFTCLQFMALISLRILIRSFELNPAETTDKNARV